MARFQWKQEEIAYRIEMEKFLFSVHCSQKWLENGNNEFIGAVGQYNLTHMFPKSPAILEDYSFSQKRARERRTETNRERGILRH